MRHLDGNKKNNAAVNLAYGSHQENSDDQVRHGTTRKGERHPLAKLTEADVSAIRASPASHSETARAYGVSNQLVSRIRLREIWKHV